MGWCHQFLYRALSRRYKNSFSVASSHYGKYDGPAEIKLISQEEFDKTIEKQSTAGGTLPRVGVYVHGVVQNTDEVVQKAAEISADSNETIVVEDWDTGRERQTTAHNDPPGAIASTIRTWFNTGDSTRENSERMINASIDHLGDRFERARFGQRADGGCAAHSGFA